MRSLIALGLIVGAAAAVALILPRCADESYFQAEAGPGDSYVPADAPEVTDIYVNPCAPEPPPAVTGVVYAPNGIDPVAGASVHVAVGLMPLPQTVQCETCAVKGKFSAHVYTKADGSFRLEGVPNAVPFKLGIQKGHFRRFLDLTVPECGTLDLPKAQTTLPGKNKQFGPYDSIPNIAVVSGIWDKMEKVLDKLGVPPSEVTIYNGRTVDSGSTGMQHLIQNAALMKSFHIILIDCGTYKQYEALVADEGPARYAIREYVRAGGRLFVTDLSYDYVEQVFPEHIDFEGSDTTPANVPEDPNAAEQGTENLTVHADVLDPDLKAWLALPEIKALLPDGKVEIVGFATGWAVQKTVDTALTGVVWVSGPVKWWGGTGVRPLTTSFEFLDTDKKGCGRVVFSSYHTWGDATELLPQERILEYLLLEIGTCIDLK